MWKKGWAILSLLLGIAALSACGGAQNKEITAVSAGDLRLTRAVLYQNGIGYFERAGTIHGDKLTLRIRADQVNDFLKSLTVIDTTQGKAVSVSLPLDRTAAKQVMELANRLKEGISLPDLLALLKGSEVSLIGRSNAAIGRILAVDPIWDEEKGQLVDYRISVMDRSAMHTILLSDVLTIRMDDGFIALGLHKGLDAAASGGVFKVVDVTVRLDRGGRHDLVVSYVVESPSWKPSYRIVVGEKREVLLQGWAVVDNVTGEDWSGVDLSLTSGAPIAFRYDLYAPRFVGRPDLTSVASQKSARAQVGETSYTEAPPPEASAPPAPMAEPSMARDESEGQSSEKKYKRLPGKSGAKAPASRAAADANLSNEEYDQHYYGTGGAAAQAPMGGEAAPETQVSIESLQASARSMVKAVAASGSVRYDLLDPVSVPDRSSTLVSILNNRVPGEEAFLYTPGGGGQGYEQNPYRVVRFTNSTGFILEPGPISIYSGGTFVGEGISESIADKGQATIPFAVDASILVTSYGQSTREGARLVKLAKGVLIVESFDRVKTTYTVKGGDSKGFRLYARHQKAGMNYKFKDKPKDTEDLGEAYLVPIDVDKGAKETQYTVVEETAVRQSLTIWDDNAVHALELVIKEVKDLPKDMRKKLEDILDKRGRIATIDIKLTHLHQQQAELDQRMFQTRQNLSVLQKNKAAGGLKAQLAKRLEEYSRETDETAKQIVDLTNQRMELKVAIEDAIAEMSFDF